MGKIVEGVMSFIGLGGSTQQVSKQSIRAPSSAIASKEEEDEVKLGSDRADDRTKRSKGRRQLMTPQPSPVDKKSTTGLQI